ncbi:MAG: hypothetical protein OEM50_09610 [Gammaproteobacteria bacterium]|nr:hypothetical protein [Gammaproteobacteria bacterium]MDH3363698.1 hypothetical protein [Gammaproteobacteria bacterium]MDH3481959.1 hypothetical protein [Gammaproteobacteria bacterium]
MEYQGPTADDLVNIHALNRLFLRAISASAVNGIDGIADRRLTDSQLSRLAGAPFLLFSFRERDNDYWQRLLADDPQIDLIDSGDPLDEHFRELQVAGLSFLWQLVRRNPYAARVVSGAPVSWCERVGGLTLVSFLQKAATRPDLLRMRFADNDTVWRRLLQNGISTQRQTRLASHHSALQSMLTRTPEPNYGRLSAAACRIRDKKV